MTGTLKSFFTRTVLKDRVLLPLVCGLMFLKRYLLLEYGYNYEEGKELECVINILNGKLVFRDFWWQYGPGPLYFIALLSNLFDGPSFLLGRTVVTLGAVAMTFYAYRVSRFYLPSSWAFWAALLASSGLAFREGTYGHIFAYLGMIGSWYYLLTFFRNERGSSELIKSGLFVFMTLLSKPIVFGVCSIAAGIICLSFWFLTRSITPFPFVPISLFLTSSVIPSGLIYGYLYWKTPTKLFLAQLFPMTSGSFFLSDFKLKPILPPMLGESLIVWKNQLNHYLVDDLRWWTIFLTLIISLGYLIGKGLKQPKELSSFLPLFSLVVYGFLIESETLILLERPITFFINMLPNYILLAIFFIFLKEKLNKNFIVYGIATFFCLFYFFYSPLRLGAYYFGNSKALGLPYAETIQTPEYTWGSYRNIAKYIQSHSKPNEPILYAGYDTFIYWASKRPSPFPEDFAVFTRVSFHPYHSTKKNFSNSFYEEIEKKIVDRIKSNPPPLIIIPNYFLKEKNVKVSPFLKYLLENWRSEADLNGNLQRGPFDMANLHVKAFVSK